MHIRVRFFARARELAGLSETSLDLSEASTIADLKASLIQNHPALGPILPYLLIAMNSDYARDEEVVLPGAEVAIIPPVSGGSNG